MEDLKLKWNARQLKFFDSPEGSELIENWERALFLPYVVNKKCPSLLYVSDLYEIIAGLVYLTYGLKNFKIIIKASDTGSWWNFIINMDCYIGDGTSLTIYTDSEKMIKGYKKEEYPEKVRDYMLNEDKGPKEFWDTIIKNAEIEMKEITW